MRTYKIGLGVVLVTLIWTGVTWYFHWSSVWPICLVIIAVGFFVYDRVDESRRNKSYARVVRLHEKLVASRKEPKPDLGQCQSDATRFCGAVTDHVTEWPDGDEPRMNQYRVLYYRLSEELWHHHQAR